ncbi:MAG: ferredoxin [Deltaproteobacteria bacterium HGW-Deltaproteobacteria-9]|nr:MAG: ferredoxin [Deltaproteobacteria bacterium HGW-Deltaproteobacteria-9]
MKINFTLNGIKTEIDTASDRRVVDILREDLGLTGTKEGCGAGECGACTILVGGKTRLSCLMLAAQLEGLEILTVEGLAADGNMHPIQQAFVHSGAVQCGFCTPGMLISAHALLMNNPDPSREEIREGLSGNLCRCTGYSKIVDAVESAAANMSRKENP